MPTKWQRFRVDVPEELTAEQRERLADLIIEHIKQRSEEGRDKNGKSFPRYSESYIKSLDFKIAGKSKNSIDLTLSGDMLASIDLLSDKRGSLLIGFERGSEENARADGNIRGTYGKSTPDRKKARDFLGIQPEYLNRFIEEVKE